MLYHKKVKKQKNSRQLEKHFKGLANHRRIDVLILVAKNPGITLENISENLNCNFKTISDHVRKLSQTGLVNKTYQGTNVKHTLSPYGKIFYEFIRTF